MLVHILYLHARKRKASNVLYGNLDLGSSSLTTMMTKN
jgi:hypothetical protein